MMSDAYMEGISYGMENRALLHSLMQPERERLILQQALERYSSSEDIENFLRGIRDGSQRGPNTSTRRRKG